MFRTIFIMCSKLILLLNYVQCLRASNYTGWRNIHFWVGNGQESKITTNMEWNSQVMQDRIVMEILDNKRAGYFIDLAANNATLHSNTLSLENKFNWTGLCIEANPIYFGDLIQRKCTVIAAAVFSHTGKQVTFNFEGKHDNKLDGTLGGIVHSETDNKEIYSNSVVLNTISLYDLFIQFNVPKIIDYLSFDVEGSEWKILGTFPLSIYTFRVISFERPTPAAHRKLVQNGYSFYRVLSIFGECIYIHSKQVPRFNEIMSTSTHLRVLADKFIRQHQYLLYPPWNSKVREKY